MSLHQQLSVRLDGTFTALNAVRDLLPTITVVCNVIVEKLGEGGTLYTCGNGGSAAQASHLAEELIGRYRGNRGPRRAMCLNADPAALTCIANDFGYESVFARQCEALLTNRDVLLVLSTSGNSPNIMAALQAARARRATTIGLLGNTGGACDALCDHHVIIPGRDSAHIQDAHQVVIHLICEAVELATPGAPA